MDTAQKQKRAEWFNSFNSAQKHKRAKWHKSLNPEEKEKLLSGRAEWYKTLDPADKDKIIPQVQTTKEAHGNSVQHDLDHKITAFQSKIGKVHIMFSLFVTENIQKNFKKTNVQHSARTIY